MAHISMIVNTPALSVLMPVFNAERHLDASIASIVGQDFRDWELVAVDDGSTDGSPEILARWAACDPRVRVIANPANKGQTPCLNQGLAACRGGWVARQDADDLSHPRRFSRQMAHVAGHPEVVLLGTQGILINEGGVRMGLLDVPRDANGIAWCAPFLNPFLHTAVMFRRDVVLAAGGYDESCRIAQDYELWTRLAAGHSTANLAQRLVSYRHAESSLSKTGRDLAFAEADRVSDREVRRLLGRPWRAEERVLVSAFRQGMGAGLRRGFWKMIRAMERETSRILPGELRAAWHLRLAGAGGAAAAGEVAAAFGVAPFATARWFCGRFLSS